MFDATTVGPTGVPKITAAVIPKTAAVTEKMHEATVTDLKLLNNCNDVTEGKIISAEIRSEPTRFIARTIITAVNDAVRKL